MIGLSRFRSAVVKEPLVKVAYVTPETANAINETGMLQSDPGYLGTGCLVEVAPGTFQLKTVGVAMENVLEETDSRRSRAYRWVLDEPDTSCYITENMSASAEERMQHLLTSRYRDGWYPYIDVWVVDRVTEDIGDHDYSVVPPKGEYRNYAFVTIVNYPLFNEYGVRLYDEYVCLVTDVEQNETV